MPGEPLLQTVRASAQGVAAAAHLPVRADAVDAFLRAVDAGKYEALRQQHGIALPLRFDSFAEEVNLLSVLSLLNAFSGYRDEFHQATQQGAFDNVRRLVLSLFLTRHDDGSSSLSAQALQQLRPGAVASALGVSMHREEQHPTLSFVTVGTRNAPLNPVLELIAQTCNAAGAFVAQQGCADLGTFVLQAAEQALQSEQPESAFLRRMLAVPGFDDVCSVDGHPVYLMKKALFLFYTLLQRAEQAAATDGAARRLAERAADGRLVASLPMFVDNVIPTMLVHFGILDTADTSVAPIRGWRADRSDGKRTGPVLEKQDAYRVRGAALHAGQCIVARAHEIATEEGRQFLASMCEVDLDGYLWSLAKEPAFRSIPRLAEKGTCMY